MTKTLFVPGMGLLGKLRSHERDKTLEALGMLLGCECRVNYQQAVTRVECDGDYGLDRLRSFLLTPDPKHITHIDPNNAPPEPIVRGISKCGHCGATYQLGAAHECPVLERMRGRRREWEQQQAKYQQQRGKQRLA